MTAKILQGDCIEVLKTLEAGTVQTCVTSPPYYGLRDYGTAEWEGGEPNCNHVDDDKVAERKRQKKSMIAVGESLDGSTRTREHDESIGKDWQYRDACKKCGALRIDSQIGIEPTPEAYVEKLVQVFREVRRVLKDDGTLWLNLGDSYNGSGGAGGDYSPGGLKEGQPKYPGRNIAALKPKDLLMIPARVALALQADGWWLRSEIIWRKPNPMPESVTDRPTKSHEMIYLLAKSARYYYDAEAVREPAAEPDRVRGDAIGHTQRKLAGRPIDRVAEQVVTRNRRDVWTVTTKPYKGAHFATFPPDLIEPCILAGTSAKGECPECGKAWVRVVEDKSVKAHDGETETAYATGSAANRLALLRQAARERGEEYSSAKTTTGWAAACTCGADPIPQTVLDPFNGSGTTAAVSVEHGRNAIGIELNPDYIELTHKRLADVQPIMIG